MAPGKTGKAPVPVPRSLEATDLSLSTVLSTDLSLSTVLSTDLSLSSLICSVERDILRLEQMETSDSPLGHLPSLPSSSSSPTPPLSSQLLSLPGYRPRPPPASPSVVNPGYDALLWRRLHPLPSPPPPPLPTKLGHRRRNSDSVCLSSPRSSSPPPHPTTPDSPEELTMAARLTRHCNLALPRLVFCPFCVAHFYHQQQLQEHLVQAHSEELELLRKEELGGFRPETCPCCQAQFLQAGLGSRHLVHHHPEYVISLLLGRLPAPSGRPPPFPQGVPSTPPPDRHAFCLLCGQRFLKRQAGLLALHLQQQHPQQFCAALAQHCDMAPAPQPLRPQHYTPPQALSPPHHYEVVDGSPTKEAPGYLQLLPPQPSTPKRGRREQQTPQRSKHTRSFKRSAPRMVGETYQGIAQPEPPSGPGPGPDTSAFLLEEEDGCRENYLHYSTHHLLYRCNLCGERFDVNDLLLSHLKNDHMAVSRVLKPQYSCAKCPANFFKNAFLLKHSLIHKKAKDIL